MLRSFCVACEAEARRRAAPPSVAPAPLAHIGGDTTGIIDTLAPAAPAAMVAQSETKVNAVGSFSPSSMGEHVTVASACVFALGLIKQGIPREWEVDLEFFFLFFRYSVF